MGTSSPATQTEITFVVAKGALDGVVWQVAEEQVLVDSDGAVAEYYCTPCTPDRHNQLTGRKS